MLRRQTQPGDCETPADREWVENMTHAYLDKVMEPERGGLDRIPSESELEELFLLLAQQRIRDEVIKAAKKRDVPEMLRVAGDDPALLKLALVESHKKHPHGRVKGEKRRGDDPFRDLKELTAQQYDHARKYWKDTFGKTYSGKRNANFLRAIIDKRTIFTVDEILDYLKDRKQNRNPA
jgi:hypothetical protein